MRRVLIPMAVCLSAIVVAAAPRNGQSAPQGQTGTQAPVFRSLTSAVAVDVSVRDQTRKSLIGLKATDFIVADNGVRQTVTEVSYGTRPIDVTIGLDVSTSVTGPVLESLRRAVVQLMGDLRKEDRLKLLVFNNEIHRASEFTTDVRAVEAAMRRVQAGGGTFLYDAISVALVGAADPNRRQLVVVFTDGADSGSTLSTSTLRTVAERTRATLTFVVSGEPPIMLFGSVAVPIRQGTEPNPSASIFGRLAAETGGTVVSVADVTTVSAMFRRILDEFRSTYVVFYTPNGVDRTGYHTIGVDVAKPGAVVQARRGYFGG